MNLGQLIATIKADTAQFDQAMSKSMSSLKSMGGQMKAVGKKMTMAVTLPLAGIATASIRAGMNFEAAMNQVAAVSGATATQLQQMEDVARQMGATSKFSATEAAEGLNFLAMAGFSVNEAMSALPATLELAAAGNMGLGESADIVSNIMSGFGIAAENTAQVGDVLTKAFTSSNTTLGDLGIAMSYAAPTMKTFGQSVETASAAIGALSDAGIQGSRAGTGLQQVMTQLVLKGSQLGIQMRDSAGNMRPLFDIIGDINDAGIDGETIMKKFGARAGPSLLVLLEKGKKGLQEFEDGLKDSTGTASRVAAKQMEGLKGAFTELRSALSELGIAFSQAGISSMLEGIVDALRDAALWLSETSDTTKRFIAIVVGIVGVLGPVRLALGFLSTNVLPGLIAMFGRVSAVIKGLWAVMAANPIVAIVAGIAAVTAAIYLFATRASFAEQVERRLADAAKEATKPLIKQKTELSLLSEQLDRNKKSLDINRKAVEEAAEGSIDYKTKVAALKDEEDKRRQIIETLNSKYGEYMDNELTMKSNYDDITQALKNVNAQLDIKIAKTALQAKTEALVSQLADAWLKVRDLRAAGPDDPNWIEKVWLGSNWISIVHGVGADAQKELQWMAEIIAAEKEYDILKSKYQEYDNELKTLLSDITTPDATDAGQNGKTIGETVADGVVQGIESKAEENGKTIGETVADGVVQGIESKAEEIDKTMIDLLDARSFKVFRDELLGMSDTKIKAEFKLLGDDQLLADLGIKLQQITEQSKLFGDSFDVVGEKMSVIKQAMIALINDGFSAMSPEVQSLKEQYDALASSIQTADTNAQFVSDTLMNFSQNIANTVRQAMTDMISSFVQFAVSSTIAGKATQNFGVVALKGLANLLQQLGQMAIMVGLTLLAIQGSIATLNPVLAIGAGVALIALATGIKALAGNIESRDTKGYSNIPQMASGGIVPSGYPNDTYPALLTSGEMVVPPGKLPAMASVNNNQDVVDAITKKKEVTLNITESGVSVVSKKGNSFFNYVDRKYRGK